MKPEKNKEKQFETCRFYIYIYVCVYLVLIIINLSPGPVGNVLSSFYWIMDNISSGYMNKYVGNPSIVLLIQMDFSLLSAFYLESLECLLFGDALVLGSAQGALRLWDGNHSMPLKGLW